MRIAVIMPVYGQEYYTYAVRDQLEEERYLCDLFIVDNMGTYKKEGWEQVIVPGENLRWTKGTNRGIIAAACNDVTYSGFLLLNNDVRLSYGFINGLQAAANDEPFSIIGPCYDDVHEHQLPSDGTRPLAHNYISAPNIRPAKFVDGTAMYVPTKVVQQIGILDEQHFGNYGWGADYDYCIRARSAGYSIIVTERSYLNHFHQATAKTIDNNWNGLAGNEMEAGMCAKYGSDWRKLLW